MAVRHPTIWPLDEHSRAKHLVLQEYLKAWLPIMTKNRGRLVLIDGFAGPGVYQDGEEGSPLILARRACAAAARAPNARLIVVLAEEHRARFDSLSAVLAPIEASKPATVAFYKHHGAFADAIDGLRTFVSAPGRSFPPSFTMIDPFGVKGVRFDDIHWLLQQPKPEIYLSFMTTWVARFRSEPEFEEPLDAFFGNDEWRALRKLSYRDALEGLNALVEATLRRAGAKHVLRFDLYSGNVSKYSIFFATRHPLGCQRMKEAIWRVMPDGSYAYRGRQGEQLTLEMFGVSEDALHAELFNVIEDGGTFMLHLLNYMRSDKTRFHETHLRKALRGMEEKNLVTIRRPPGKRGIHEMSVIKRLT